MGYLDGLLFEIFVILVVVVNIERCFGRCEWMEMIVPVGKCRRIVRDKIWIRTGEKSEDSEK